MRRRDGRGDRGRSAGYLLGTSGGYGGPTFERHLQLGIVRRDRRAAHGARRRGAGSGPGPAMRIVRAALVLTLAALTAAGHLGATLTHGEGYLTEFAPAPLRTLIASVSGAPAAAAFTGPVERAPVYPTLVRPVLQRHCVSCHAAGAARGGLVLDTPEAILKGGDHGPVVTPGRALASELVRRVWLPADHADVMPPRGQRPLPAADAGLLRWWIDSGASFEQPLAELDVPPDVLPVIEARLGPLARGGPTIPPVSLAAPDPARLAAIRDRGVDLRPIADGSPFLEARVSGREPPADDGRVASLAPLAPHVLWLTLADTAITDAAFPAIAKMTNLTRLDVSRTATTDRGLLALAPLAQLETLNLYDTRRHRRGPGAAGGAAPPPPRLPVADGRDAGRRGTAARGQAEARDRARGRRGRRRGRVGGVGEGDGRRRANATAGRAAALSAAT